MNAPLRLKEISAGCYAWPSDVPLPDGLANGERRFEMETFGPWSIITKLRGLAVEKVDGEAIVHGDRNLQDRTQEGYAMHGTVSVGGIRRGAFTSDLMIQLPDGKLATLAILYVCKPRSQKNEQA